MTRALICLLVGASLVGCALPWQNRYSQPNNRTASPPVASQGDLEQDWVRARDGFRERVAQARNDGNVPPLELAALIYEYGRTSGVLCDWQTASLSLEESYELDKSNGGPSHMSLVELARLNLAQEQYEEARRYFSMAIPELDSVDADKRDPMGFVDIIEEYSAVLSKLGETKEAAVHRDRGKYLRQTSINSVSRSDITPYGAFCPS